MPTSPRQPSDTTSLTSSVPTVSMRNKAILVYIAGAATIVFALNAWADRPGSGEFCRPLHEYDH